MRMAREGASGRDMTTKHLGTKLTLASGSFLAFAALTLFIGAREQQADISAAATTAPIVADRVIAQESQSTQDTAPVEQQVPTPVTRSRGT
jgi:hypothetical protein